MDVFGPTSGLQPTQSIQTIQNRFRAQTDEAIGQYGFWFEQNMAWLHSHLEDLQSQQRQKKSLAALMQSPAKKSSKHSQATSAGLKSPFKMPNAPSHAENPFLRQQQSPSPDKENRSPSHQIQQTKARSPPVQSTAPLFSGTSKPKRPISSLQSPAKPSPAASKASAAVSPSQTRSPAHKRSKPTVVPPKSPARSPPKATSSPSPRKIVQNSQNDAENRPLVERPRVISTASSAQNTSGEDDAAMIEASLLATSQQFRPTPHAQQSKLPTPASPRPPPTNRSNGTTTPPFSPGAEQQTSVSAVSSIKSRIQSPRVLPSRTASPREPPPATSSQEKPPPPSSKSSTAAKDKSRRSLTMPQSPVSAFLTSHTSRPSTLNFKGLRATQTHTENGNTSLFGPAQNSMHYTSKAFQSMTYNAPSKVPDREEHLPSRVLPPSLFNTSKDVEVPLKDENEKPAAGRSRVEALMNKVESLSKSAGTSRASAAQRGDVSIAPGNTDMSMFASQTDTEAQIEVDEPEPTPATQEHPSTVPFEEVKASSPKQETAPSSEQSVDAEDDIMSQPLPAEHDTDEEAEFEPERPVEDPEPEINIKESRNIEIEEEDVGEESEVEDDGSVAQSEDDREEPEVQTQRPSPVSTKTTAATEGTRVSATSAVVSISAESKQSGDDERLEAKQRPSTSSSSIKKIPTLKQQSSTAGLKSLQRAAAAREKEQQETQRRAAIKEERDQQRRLQLIAKQQEEERRAKAQADAQKERKRKEAEERSNTSVLKSSVGHQSTIKNKVSQQSLHKSVTKATPAPPADSQSKRRKVDSDAGNQTTSSVKPIIRVPAQQPSRPATAMGKYSAAPTASASTQPMRKPEPATGPSRAVPASAAKSKAAPTTHAGPSSGTSSKVPLNTKASIKLKVPPKELPQSEPEEPYEELPSIASEYSDSDDDTQSKKTAALPNWAQSPALKAQLIAQSRIDPDDVFGAIPDLKLEEIFRGRKHQFRARSSSAHWSGPDALSKQEEAAYAKRMNYIPSNLSQQ